MNILRIKIENINSIEYADIDFRSEILASQPIFLISGKTGAGKSTILDAICLALYGTTPRLKQAPQRDSKFYINGVKEGEPINANNPATLLRNGASQGSVHLDFEGIDRQLYTAKWCVSLGARSHKLKKCERFLISHDENNVEQQSVEIKNSTNQEELDKIIGLTFDQFCKTSLLAQGEFTRFLKSNNSEKAAILEQITGTEIYALIGKKIFDEKKRCEDELDTLQLKIGEQKVLSQEELSARQQQIQSLNNDINTLSQQRQTNESRLKWLENQQSVQQSLASCHNNIQTLQQQINSPTFKNQQSDVTLWRLSEPVRNILLDIKKDSDSLAFQKTRTQDFKTRYEQALAWLGGVNQEINTCEKQKNQASTTIAQYAQHANMLAQSASLIEKLTAQTRDAQTINNAQKSKQQAQSQLSSLSAGLEKAKSDVQNKKSSLEKITKNAQQLSAEIANANPEATSAALTTCRNLISELDKFTTSLAEINNKSQEIKSLTQENETTHLSLAKAEKSLAQASSALASAQKSREEMELRLGAVEQILQKLHAGDSCPVCGGKIKEVHLNKFSAENLNPLIEAEKTCKEKVEDLQKEKISLEEKTKLNNEQLNKFNKELTEKQQSLQTQQLSINEAFKETLPISLTPKNAPEITASLQQNLKSLESQEAQITSLRQAREFLLSQQEKTQNLYNDALAAQQSAQNLFNDTDSKIKSADALISQKQKEFADTKAQLKTAITYTDDWQSLTPESLSARLSADAQSLQNAQNQLDKAEVALAQLNDLKTNIALSQQNILTSAPAWSNISVQPTQPVPDTLNKWHALDSDIRTWKADIQRLNTSIKKNIALRDDFFLANKSLSPGAITALTQTYNAQSIKSLEDAIKEKTDALASAQGALAQAEKQKSVLDAQRPQNIETFTIDSLVQENNNIEKQKSEKNRALGSLQAEIKASNESRKRIEDLIKEIEEKQKSFNVLAELNTFIGDANGNKFRSLAQSFVFKELLHYANGYLNRLTHNRFALVSKSDNIGDLDIFIRDAFNGGRLLTPTGISGGESFLTSLALALGLSAFAVGANATADILFIDEGFGSLDGEFRNLVMNTLNRLHDIGGRRVGIISHVDEFKERIDAQILVRKIDNSRSIVEIKRGSVLSTVN